MISSQNEKLKTSRVSTFPSRTFSQIFKVVQFFSEQMRLIQKLGDGARPFTLAFPQTAPNSVLVKKCPRLLCSTGSNWLELIVVVDVVGCSIVGADAIVVGEEVCGVVGGAVVVAVVGGIVGGVVVVVAVVSVCIGVGGGDYANNDSTLRVRKRLR